jgi:pre-mRNA cleavage complex 2 protein Pcf11
MINSLSMVAEDHADSKSSAKAVYKAIRQKLLTTSRENMLPLVYVLDSILKNAKGAYIAIVEDDAASWIPIVYRKLQDDQRAKLQKVWKTWDECNIFSPARWKEMGSCFDERTTGSDKTIGSSAAKVAGISRTVRIYTFFSSSIRLCC